MSFNQWLAEVNVEVENTCGLSLYDLPDVELRDMYDDELSPREAANEALDNSGFNSFSNFQ